MLRHADGAVEALNQGWYQSDWIDLSVTLTPGDSLVLNAVRWGSDCSGAGGLSVGYAQPGDTADWFSPNISPYQLHSIYVVVDQPGSYYVTPWDVDWGFGVRLFVDAAVKPYSAGLAFAMPYPNAIVEHIVPGDTCRQPCISAYLLQGQSVLMWAESGGVVPPGGHALVRFAPEGDTVTFFSPVTVAPLAEDGSYSFSADGSYLLSVEDSSFTASTYAVVRVSHLPYPRLDMSLTIERADGTEEVIDYMQPNNPSSWSLDIELGTGDSLRVEHHAITEPCDSVRLHAYKSDDWTPAFFNDPLVLDTPSTANGVRLAQPGSYFLTHVSGCNVPTCQRRITINASIPQLDFVVSVNRSNGTEEELFRTHELVDPPPHLAANLGQGDSVRVYVDLITGWCSVPLFQIRESGDSGEATQNDPLSEYNGYYSFHDLTFRNAGRHLIQLEQAYTNTCFEDQDVFLDVNLHTPEIDLLVDHIYTDGTSIGLAQAEPGQPATYTQVELLLGDSLLAKVIGQFGPCPGLMLKGYRSESYPVTTQDPVFLYSPVDSAGVMFRETGSLLLTVEDNCEAVTGSAILNVSEAFSTGISSGTVPNSNFGYAEGSLFIHTEWDARLQVRNAMGQLVLEMQMDHGTRSAAVSFQGEAPGMYIATLRGFNAVDSYKFIVN